ncbi:PREDICTED: putative leucine-rich repeat receptor-like serine/threonine-protein kinase At2g24130 [Camelina sativa]|uniref:Leucine-rich repeat receptor-like serine/threonine-protein kinase At2g24130 n=1 Tax=Camelina sativa TaxID=90675 RepID=A0ABM0T803_CAMSA|nr:PREDICTED: putative leucine-rich repeat receptor-like serine/threonine-protein kinase At2g24130 [Camelina sativa]
MLKQCPLSCLLFIFFFIPKLSFSCPQDQGKSLLEFKNLLMTHNVKNRSTGEIDLMERFKTWRPNSDCCKWQLVRCNARSPSREVIGEIPGDAFVNLTSLISLDMSENSFHGSIPPTLYSLKSLRHLDLSRNVIGGMLSGDIKELKNLQELILDENLIVGLNETFLVASIIEKLPPTWKDFKTHLKHIHEDRSLEQLILKLRVEEENRKNEKSEFSSMEAKANVVEGNSSKFKGFKKNKNVKRTFIPPKGSNFKKKPQGACWVCGKHGIELRSVAIRKKGHHVEKQIMQTSSKISSLRSFPKQT